MTIVVFKDGVMAADSLVVTGSEVIAGEAWKIFQISGMTIGAAGHLEDILKLKEWLLQKFEPEKKPKFSEDFEGMVHKDGKIFYITQTAAFLEIENDFHVIGSGGEIAMGAMEAGATAIEAVRIVIKFDICCGGSIRSFDC